MKRIRYFSLLMFMSIVVISVKAQDDSFETVMAYGVKDYEQSKYDEALSWFKQAYKLNKNSNEALYELAITNLSLEKYQDAIHYCGIIMKNGEKYLDDAYLISGSAWEKLGRVKKAQKIYEKGIKLFPDNQLLHYNMALALFNNHNSEEAQKFVIKSIELDPMHASSHLLLSYIMFDLGERVKSMLPLYYFLLIEQDSDRSETAYDFLESLWNQGVRVKGRREIQLLNSGIKTDDFVDAELAISLINGYNHDSENAIEKLPINNIRLEEFANNNQKLFKVLTNTSKGKYGFWWEFYVSFLSKIDKNNFSEAFSYFISNCKYNQDVLLWLSDNHTQFQKFSNWMEQQ